MLLFVVLLLLLLLLLLTIGDWAGATLENGGKVNSCAGVEGDAGRSRSVAGSCADRDTPFSSQDGHCDANR